jgi:hypothetical protein
MALGHRFALAGFTVLSFGLGLILFPVAAAAEDGVSNNGETPRAASGPHYLPVPGRLVGIWPDSRSVERLRELRTDYGFTGVQIRPWGSDEYRDALEAGFLPENIMVQTGNLDYVYAVDSLDAGFYFIDEAVEHNCSGEPSGFRIYTLEELQEIRTYVEQHRPNASFVISGYKRCSHNRIASNYAHIIMYPSYANWDPVVFYSCTPNMGFGDATEPAWLKGNVDQRESWTDMRSTYGSKFSMAWIDGRGDEYNDLFSHAGTLGLDGIWMYNEGDIDSVRLEDLCTAAVENGWMTRGDTVTSVEEAIFPDEFRLHQNYPNPFNPSTTIKFDLPHAGYITLTVHNLLGEEVARLAAGSFAPGTFTAVWDANGQPSGLYIYRLAAGDLVRSMRMLLLK